MRGEEIVYLDNNATINSAENAIAAEAEDWLVRWACARGVARSPGDRCPNDRTRRLGYEDDSERIEALERELGRLISNRLTDCNRGLPGKIGARTGWKEHASR